ncbi:hypothetical protein [Thiolapillus sp.]|uniref:hypothetical protein n=1 Tax=Thiolapillus sp. TaxID=2017437 RepID=UPI003AF60721
MNTAAAKGIGNPQDTLVFWLWRNMPYNRRMLISFGLIVLGFLLQWYSGEIFSGVIPLLAGNALLLVRGYDNRVEFKGFDPGQQWQKVERRRLYELEELDRKMKRWDRSFIDITNAWGVVTFVLLVAGLFMMYVFFDTHSAYQGLAVIPVDMGILLLPHWFFGTRTLQRKPGLLIKVGVLLRVLDLAKRPGLQRDAMMLLKGKEKAMPEDVKIRLLPDDAPEDFLGLYGQVVINNVQGKSYPYFYMVLVARPGMGLKAVSDRLDLPGEIIGEFKRQIDVEILVLRQFTTKTSGYHTDDEMVEQLLRVPMKAMQILLESSNPEIS